MTRLRVAPTDPNMDAATDQALAARLADPAFPSVRARMLAVDGCAGPIRLHGRYSITRNDSGETIHRHEGTVEVPCGNRRDAVCPACSQRYAADAFHLTRSGLAGGKGTPPTVAGHPMVFLTLTAPSFGPVHARTQNRNGRVQRCRCGTTHHLDDPRVGTALDAGRYDYTGAVLWQAHASKLWNRFTVVLRRTVARLAGIKVRELGEHLKVSFAKVAEYQRRGLVHFHAVIRFDSFAGPVLPPPPWATTELLTEAIGTAAGATATVQVPGFDGVNRPLTLGWGPQLDVRPITDPTEPTPVLATDDPGEAADGITRQALAGYIAKYATKSTGATSGTDRRLRTLGDIAVVPATAHHRRLMLTCWALGARPGLERLRRWAHMLGFGGHFLTKSRTYSTTFGALRGARREHARALLLEHLEVGGDEITVINDWHYAGTGWEHPADPEIAVAIHERHQQQKRERYRAERPERTAA